MCPSLVHPTPNTKSNHARTKRWMNNNYMNKIIHNQIFAYIFLSPYFPMIELSTIWTHSRVILDWILFRSVLGRTVRARYVCRLCMCHAVSTTAVAMWGDACSTALEHRLRNDFFINVLYQCDIFHWIFEWLELCEAISCFFFFSYLPSANIICRWWWLHVYTYVRSERTQWTCVTTIWFFDNSTVMACGCASA